MDLTTAAPALKNDDGSAWWKALPFEFQNVRVSTGTRPAGFRFSKSIINIEATLDGASINACGEAETPTLAMTKAIAELIERASIMRWQRDRLSTSNGWAAHETLQQAKLNSVLELTERDAVLSQWYLSKPFIEITTNNWPEKFAEWSSSELSQSEFPNMRLLLSTEGVGPSLTCLFVNERGYGVSGHATKATLSESIDAAIAETCRAAHHAIRRSFWKDSLNLQSRAPGIRVQPGAHAVYYAYHEAFPAWMFGPEVSWADAENIWSQRMSRLIGHEISNFTFQVTMEEPIVVGFARHPQAFNLSWGTTNVGRVLEKAANRKFSALLNERNLNQQPHIVS